LDHFQIQYQVLNTWLLEAAVAQLLVVRVLAAIEPQVDLLLHQVFQLQ
jgi:hypothetical protein